MFACSIAGSLPKPFWLAETKKPWPRGRAPAPTRLARGGEIGEIAAAPSGAGRS